MSRKSVIEINENDTNRCLEIYVQQMYPYKCAQLTLPWPKNNNKISHRHMQQLTDTFLYIVRVLYGRDVDFAKCSIENLVKKYYAIKNQTEHTLSGVDNQIVDSIKMYTAMEVGWRGRTTKDIGQAIDEILTACLFKEFVAPRKLQERLNVSDTKIDKIHDHTEAGISYKTRKYK